MPSRPRWLTRKEQRDLARQLELAVQGAKTRATRCRACRDRAVIALMLHAGLRVSEVSALTLREHFGSVAIRTVATRGEKQRTIPLNAAAQKALHACLEVRPESDQPYLFLSQRGGRMSPECIYKRVKDYARRAGIEGMTPLILRRTCVKNLVDRGVSLDRVARMMG